MNEFGERKVIFILNEGEIINEVFLSDVTSTVTCEAFEKSTIIKFSKKDFIDINSKTHELTVLYKKRCVIKKVEEDINRDLFLKKYSKEHLIKSKRHKIKMKE